MRNVNELERAWMRYKFRSYLPKAAGALVVLTFLVIGTVYIFSEDEYPEQTAATASKNTSKTEIKQLDTAVSTLPVTPVKTSKAPVPPSPATHAESPVQLTPSLGFIASMDQAPASETKNITSAPVEPPPSASKVFEALVPKPKETSKILSPDPIVSVPEETSKISIDIHQDEEDIKEVIARFKVNKKPALSLFIAKRYYAIGRYRESYNYALITNDIDSDIEESWLIAAKSLVKMNEKEKAVNLLTQFIDRTFSVRAKMLLGQINNGTLE